MGLLLRTFPKPCRLLEAGSHTGHLSLVLAQLHYEVTLLDRLRLPLALAKEQFDAKNLRADFIVGDILEATGCWEGLWNSGVIQAYEPSQRALLVEKLCQLAPKVLFIYPDVMHPEFPRIFDPNIPPGITGCVEYSVTNIPELVAQHCSMVRHGSLRADDVGLRYPFQYVVGGH